MAKLLKGAFAEKGYSFYLDSPTNQQFVILDNEKMAQLQERVGFTVWEPLDERHTVVRFVTGWPTTEADIAELKEWL